MNSECIVLPGASEHKLDEAMPTFLPVASEHGVEMQVHHGALRAYSCRVHQSTAGRNRESEQREKEKTTHTYMHPHIHTCIHIICVYVCIHTYIHTYMHA